MNPREQTAAAIREHRQRDEWGIPVDECSCGWPRVKEDYLQDWPAHAADAVIDALSLEEERVERWVRWVSGWSVVGGEPSEGTLGVVDMDFCDCNRTLGAEQ